MPLPDRAFNCEGGCNCGAVRYKIAIPPLTQRPSHPMAVAAEPVPLPFIVIDHCNDCKRATSSILPAWICSPASMVSASLVSKSQASLTAQAVDRKGQPPEQRGEWRAAQDIFNPNATEPDVFLKYYQSSVERWRWFCDRCGTNIAYTAMMPEGFPAMVDVVLGSVDREYLEGEALAPERHLWWDCGVGWIRTLATKGMGGLPVHPTYDVAKTVEL